MDQLKQHGLTALLSIVATIGTGWLTVGAEARAAAKREVEPVKVMLSQVFTELHEVRIDLRESYKAQKTGEPSPRLESPLPPVVDAGQEKAP